MPSPIPRLSLTHGQAVWALCSGEPASAPVLDQLRYLRQLGIPFNASELGTGRGNRILYNYDQLVETGVGLFGLRRGMRPIEIARLIIDNRQEFRRLYRKAYRDQPAAVIQAFEIKNRDDGPVIFPVEMFLLLYDRFSDKPGTYEVIQSGNTDPVSPFAHLTRAYPAAEWARALLPLTNLVLDLVAWAREAPEIKPGRK